MKDYEGALGDAMTARTLDPRLLKGWFREGEAYMGLKRYQEAAEAYFMAVELDKDNGALTQAFLDAVEAGKREYEAKHKK